MTKPLTIADEARASLRDWLRCYGRTIARDPELWLRGLASPRDVRQLEDPPVFIQISGGIMHKTAILASGQR